MQTTKISTNLEQRRNLLTKVANQSKNYYMDGIVETYFNGLDDICRTEMACENYGVRGNRTIFLKNLAQDLGLSE